MKYYVLKTDDSLDDAVVIDGPPINGPKNYKYFEFKPLARLFPSEAQLHYSSKYPEGMKLYSFVDNTCNLLIVSDETKNLLSTFLGNKVEYLPVTMVDHRKNTVEDEPYFIVNTLEPIDYIDMDNTKAVMDSFEEDEIMSIKGELFIKRENIPEGIHMFRSRNWPRVYIVSQELADVMQEAGLTGYVLEETAISD